MSFNIPKPTVPDPSRGTEGELLSPHNRGLGMPPRWTGGGGGGDGIGVVVVVYLIGGLLALFGLAKECAQEKPSQTSRQVQTRRGTAASTQIPNLILWNDHKNNYPKCEGTYTNRGKIVWFANGTCDVEPDKNRIELSGHSNQFEMCTFTGRKRASGGGSLYAVGNLCCGARLSELSSCYSIDVPMETREAISYGRPARRRQNPPAPAAVRATHCVQRIGHACNGDFCGPPFRCDPDGVVRQIPEDGQCGSNTPGCTDCGFGGALRCGVYNWAVGECHCVD